jgi:hypothetical protein
MISGSKLIIGTIKRPFSRFRPRLEFIQMYSAFSGAVHIAMPFSLNLACRNIQANIDGLAFARFKGN